MQEKCCSRARKWKRKSVTAELGDARESDAAGLVDAKEREYCIRSRRCKSVATKVGDARERVATN